MNVSVVGCGYVGLVTGVGLASVGHDVVAIEADDGRRAAIAAGAPPFYEPGLEELLRAELGAGRFRVEGDPELAREAEVIFLAVQTPPTNGGSIDLRFLEHAARQLASVLGHDPGKRRVVGIRSTVLPGTAAHIVRPALAGRAWVASNPEFLREGSALSDFLEADRVVIGCDEEGGRELLAELYRPLSAPIVFTSPATAEAAKYASNALFATLISFSNEIARMCETLPGVDVDDVLAIVHRDRRLTPVVGDEIVAPGVLSYLKAGCGFGGSCLPKDLSALLAAQSAQGFEHPLLAAVLAVNETQPGRVVDLLEQRLGKLQGRSVTVLGAAFKGGTDDVRSSPGLKVVDRLLDRGARVTLYDPLVRAPALSSYAARGVAIARGLAEALEAADACIVTTNASEFSGIAETLAARPEAPCLVLDARRILDPSTLGDAYMAVGRGPSA
jgi:UDPglucose 6-dehydrogenase